MSQLEATLRAIVDDMIARIDKFGPMDWRPPWSFSGGLPANAVTGNTYQGANVLLLWGAQLRHGWDRTTWATYKQWASIGGRVRKGEHGQHCVKWSPVKDKKNPERTILVPSSFVVFHVEQQDGGLVDDGPEPRIVDPLPEFERFIAAVPHKWNSGEPSYSPVRDVVYMPPREWFNDDIAWAGIYAHELAHWTGHESRLNRTFGRKFGDSTYAVEELTAEISAAFTCAQLVIDAPARRDDHLRYVKNWITVLKADPRSLLTIAQAAQRATNHLLAYAFTTEQSDADEHDAVLPAEDAESSAA